MSYPLWSCEKSQGQSSQAFVFPTEIMWACQGIPLPQFMQCFLDPSCSKSILHSAPSVVYSKFPAFLHRLPPHSEKVLELLGAHIRVHVHSGMSQTCSGPHSSFLCQGNLALEAPEQLSRATCTVFGEETLMEKGRQRLSPELSRRVCLPIKLSRDCSQ